MMKYTLITLLTLVVSVIGAEAKVSHCSAHGPQACGDGCSISCPEGVAAHCHGGQLVNPSSPASGCRSYTKCSCG